MSCSFLFACQSRWLSLEDLRRVADETALSCIATATGHSRLLTHNTGQRLALSSGLKMVWMRPALTLKRGFDSYSRSHHPMQRTPCLGNPFCSPPSTVRSACPHSSVPFFDSYFGQSPDAQAIDTVEVESLKGVPRCVDVIGRNYIWFKSSFGPVHSVDLSTSLIEKATSARLGSLTE